MVKRGDGRLVQAFRRSDDGCVDRTQRRVKVLVDQLGDPQPIAGRNGFDAEPATGTVTVERRLRGR